MPRWLPRILIRVRQLAAARRVRFTLKARQELGALGLGLDEDDACTIIAALGPTDCAGRVLSETTGEWLYLFKAAVEGIVIYLKIVLRDDCIVVSFHEDEVGDDA